MFDFSRNQLAVNQQVYSHCSLGVIQYPYVYSPGHVHIECSTYSSMSITTELFPFYRHNSLYNFGADMDFICGEDFSGHMFYTYAYIRSDATNYPDGRRFDCEKIRLYYNINDTGWNSNQYVEYDTNDYYMPSIFRYQLDLYKTNMQCGDTIKLYIVAYRSSSNSADSTFWGSEAMNFGLSPMYYQQPPEYLDINTQYFEYTLNQAHDWSNWTETAESTCSTLGKESRTCNNCGAIEQRDLPLNPNNHSGGSNWVTVTNPTCTSSGSENLICNGCSAVLNTSSIPALGHNLGTWYTVQSSNCYVKGAERRDCSRCSYYEQRDLPLNPNNHSGGSYWQIVTNPTCTSSGSENLICNGCSAVLNTSSTPALGHNIGSWYTVQASTCCVKGTERRDCSRCSYYEQRDLPLNSSNHSGGSHTVIISNPTCTTAGSKREICNGCSAILGTSQIPALGHNLSGWNTIIASTCCTPGTKSRHCTRTGCNYTENESLPINPNNHSGGTYWTVTKSATCTASGIRSQICYGCSEVLSTQVIPALGHNWGGWIYQYTYYDENWQSNVRVYKRTCSRCGAVEYDYI